MRIRLQLLIAMAFVQFILASTISLLPFLVDLHFLVGLGVLAVAHLNFARLRKMPVPARLKRIARATAILATIQPLFGIPLYAHDRLGFDFPGSVEPLVAILHLVVALGIIAEASATLTAFRMWETKELR